MKNLSNYFKVKRFEFLSRPYLDFNYRFVLSAARQKHVVSKTSKVFFFGKQIYNSPSLDFFYPKIWQLEFIQLTLKGSM
jgi:hypothetical protein